MSASSNTQREHFRRTLTDVEHLCAELTREQQVCVEAWAKKLASSTADDEPSLKARDELATRLLHAVTTRHLEPPFNRRPANLSLTKIVARVKLRPMTSTLPSRGKNGAPKGSAHALASTDKLPNRSAAAPTSVAGFTAKKSSGGGAGKRKSKVWRTIYASLKSKDGSEAPATKQTDAAENVSASASAVAAGSTGDENNSRVSNPATSEDDKSNEVDPNAPASQLRRPRTSLSRLSFRGSRTGSASSSASRMTAPPSQSGKAKSKKKKEAIASNLSESAQEQTAHRRVSTDPVIIEHLNSLHAKTAKTADRHAKLRESFNELRVHNDELRAQVAEASKLLSSSSNESFQLAKEVAKLNKQMGDLTVENNEVKAENVELRTQLSECREAKVQLKGKVAKLEEDIGIFTRENKALKARVDEVQATDERCKSLDRELSDFRRQFAQHKAEVDRDLEMARQRETRLQAEARRGQAAEVMLDTTRTELDAALRERSSATHQVETLMLKLGQADNERTTLKRELEDARAMNASEMGVLKDIHAQEKAQWVARVESLENDRARAYLDAANKTQNAPAPQAAMSDITNASNSTLGNANSKLETITIAPKPKPISYPEPTPTHQKLPAATTTKNSIFKPFQTANPSATNLRSVPESDLRSVPECDLRSVVECDRVLFTPLRKVETATPPLTAEADFMVHLERVECDKENNANANVNASTANASSSARRHSLLPPTAHDKRRMSLHLDLLD